MKLMEYQARETFSSYGIPVMNGVVVNSAAQVPEKITDLKFPLVVKAQVQIGGRGKAGGIRFADNAEEAMAIAEQLLFKDIKGHRINELMMVEQAFGKQECYLSIMLDRLSKCPMIIFSSEGGIDIEETAVINPQAIIKLPVDPMMGIGKHMIQYMVNRSGIDKNVTPALYDLVKRLYDVFWAIDALLVEINPLLICDNHSLIALDGKVDVDDSALYRQPKVLEYRDKIQEEELVRAARKYQFLYIPIEDEGNIGVISNGSGMLMSSIDLIAQAGMVVGAALDLGGGATADRIKAAVGIMLGNPKIQYLYINIFGGITRCDEVALGVKTAMEIQPKGKHLIVRLEGTNKAAGIEILRSAYSGILSVSGLAEGVDALKGRATHEYFGRS